jgi:hypothetical protein
MIGRRSRLNVVRMGTIAAILGVLVVGAGVASFFLDQASRQSPLEIAPFPGAAPAGQREISPTARRQQFRVTGASADDVARYYENQLDQFTSNSGENCVRIPREGQLERSVSIVPFQFVCMFDRSGFQATQYTKVTIQPGIPNDDPALNTEGMVIIDYEQHWQR